MTPKRPATFRIDDEILSGLQAIKDKQGISVSEQVDRALVMWLAAHGSPGLSRKGGAMELRERVEGVGVVTREKDGSVIGPRAYSLAVYQRMHRVDTLAGPGGSVPGMKSVEASIDFEGHELYQLVGESLVLALEDGRTFPFFLQSSDGTIAARGGIS